MDIFSAIRRSLQRSIAVLVQLHCTCELATQRHHAWQSLLCTTEQHYLYCCCEFIAAATDSCEAATACGLGSVCAILEIQVRFIPRQCCLLLFLEQEASLTLLQPTQLYNGYLALAGEGKARPTWKPTSLDVAIQGKIKYLYLFWIEHAQPIEACHCDRSIIILLKSHKCVQSCSYKCTYSHIATLLKVLHHCKI